MPIYIESRDLDHPIGFVAEHQYLIYIPVGEELNYEKWRYIGAFPSDRGNFDGSTLTSVETTNIPFNEAVDDRWTIEDFLFADVQDVATDKGIHSSLVTVTMMVAEGYGEGLLGVKASRHRETVSTSNDVIIEGELQNELWNFLVAKAKDIGGEITTGLTGEYTYKSENISGTSSVFGPAVNSNSFITSLLRHAYVAGYEISSFNTDANIPGSKTWLGTSGNDVLDERIQFTNGDDAVDLFGGRGADTLYAGTNDSYLVAGADTDRDILVGNTGDDTLVGYFNQNDLGQSDQMSGGGGDDTFVIIDHATALAGGIPDIENITLAQGVFSHDGVRKIYW